MQDLGFRVQGLGFRVKVKVSVSRVPRVPMVARVSVSRV